MKVLITGANGFLGVQVVKKVLTLTDYQIRCFMRSTKNIDEIEALQKEYPDRIETIRGSLLNDQNCAEAVEDIDMLYHLAAATGGAPAEMFLNSSVATDHLLSAVVATGRKIKVVFCSSFSVYGTAKLPAGTLIDESTPLEDKPLKRDVYSLTKLHQEQLVKKYYDEQKLPVAVLRPGVIYGPGSAGISGRVGVSLFGIFLHLGGKNNLPLTYVENCAEAFVVVSQQSDYQFDVYNIVDDNLVTSKEFLKRFKQNVKKIRSIPVNYQIMKFISWLCEKYFSFSKGQLPDIFTRYKTASIWVNRTYSNDKLKSIGWSPQVSTDDGLMRFFDSMKSKY